MQYYSISSQIRAIAHNNLITANSADKQNEYHSVLPAEMWEYLVKFCDLKSTYTLSILCKNSYLAITPLLQRKTEEHNYQQKVPDNCLSYSIVSYKSFISPILENLDIITKTKIDEYLQRNQDEPNINKLFQEFVFQQLNTTATKITTAKGLFVNSFISGVIFFIINPNSNHCATLLRSSPNVVNICQLIPPQDIKTLTTISCLEGNGVIRKITFTPQNNLLILVKNGNEENSIKLVLFKLTLEAGNNIQQANQLWSCKINNMRDYRKTIIFPHSNDKKLILITNEKNYLVTIKDSSYDIEDFIVNYAKFTPHKKITNFVFSSNALELAVIEASDDGKRLHLFSQNSNEESFIEKSLPRIKNEPENFFYIYDYKRDVQFNKLGNICVFINGAYEVLMLNKIEGEWHCAMHLPDSWYYRLSLTLDEKNLILIKLCKDYKNSGLTSNLYVLPIADKILKTTTDPCYRRKRRDKTTIKYKNFYPLKQNVNFRGASMHIQPSALAVFIHNKDTMEVNAIFPQQLTQKNTNNLLLTKIGYYAKKTWEFI